MAGKIKALLKELFVFKKSLTEINHVRKNRGGTDHVKWADS